MKRKGENPFKRSLKRGRRMVLAIILILMILVFATLLSIDKSGIDNKIALQGIVTYLRDIRRINQDICYDLEELENIKLELEEIKVKLNNFRTGEDDCK